ncbi:cytochrome c maturation protein CcmE [Krasilnikovia sp. M28-CT-15]|uniref:cytochrome c maturation protein CcmE n=1 Tax=Krasilnikovia sp. M28-CT-15 TaxID=3373540 RepID=UPI003876394D
MSARRARLLLLLIVLAGAALLVVAGLQRTLTFYRSPSELLDGDTGQRVRLGGQVVPGSLRSDGGATWFRISDGRVQIAVEQQADLPGTIREGQDSVVEGTLDGNGVFHADTIMARHGNEYRPAVAPGGGG